MESQVITSLLAEICDSIRLRGVYARYDWCRDQLSHLLAISDQVELNDIILNMSRLSYLKDTEGHYEWCTPQYAHLLALTPEMVCGKTNKDLLNHVAAATYQAAEQQVLSDKDKTEAECQLSLPDGTVRQLKTKLYPIQSKKNKVIALLGVAREVRLTQLVPEYEALGILN